MTFLPLLFALTLAASAQTLETSWTRSSALFDGSFATLASPARPKSRTAQASSRLTLSQLAQELQDDPTAIDDLLDILASKAGSPAAAALTPENRAKIKAALNNADPAVLDRFPVLSAAQAAAGAAMFASRQGILPDPDFPSELSLTLTHSPADPPKDAYLKPLGHGLYRGDDSLSVSGSNWADTNAVAQALDMLASNDPAAPASVLVDASGRHVGIIGWLSALIAEGHTIEARDLRYYANFGHLRYEKAGTRYDVTTPTRLDTGIVLPSGRALVVPVSHSELDISIRGPRVNVELSFYFGVSGAIGFRAFDTKDMDWVGGRTVKTWRGLDAARLLERAGWVRRELMAKAKAANLPMGGYGPLGDCNDADAMVTGMTPYPMLRDPRFDSAGTPLDRLSAGLPYDLQGKPDLIRIWDSRPFEDPNDIPMADVRDAMKELKAVLGL